MSDTNSKKKPTDQLTPVKTYIRIEGNDGDDDEMALMGSPPLLPFDALRQHLASRARRYHTDHADVGAGLVGAVIGQR